MLGLGIPRLWVQEVLGHGGDLPELFPPKKTTVSPPFFAGGGTAQPPNAIPQEGDGPMALQAISQKLGLCSS